MAHASTSHGLSIHLLSLNKLLENYNDFCFCHPEPKVKDHIIYTQFAFNYKEMFIPHHDNERGGNFYWQLGDGKYIAERMLRNAQ